MLHESVCQPTVISTSTRTTVPPETPCVVLLILFNITQSCLRESRLLNRILTSVVAARYTLTLIVCQEHLLSHGKMCLSTRNVVALSMLRLHCTLMVTWRYGGVPWTVEIVLILVRVSSSTVLPPGLLTRRPVLRWSCQPRFIHSVVLE